MCAPRSKRMQRRRPLSIWRLLVPVRVEHKPVMAVGAGRSSSDCDSRCTLVDQNNNPPRAPLASLPATHRRRPPRGMCLRDILARDDKVAPGLRSRIDSAGSPSVRGPVPASRSAPARAMPPCKRNARARPPLVGRAFGMGHGLAVAGIEQRSVRSRGHVNSPPCVRSCARCRPFGFRRPDRPDRVPEVYQARRDTGRMLRLPPHRLFPFDAEPAEIVVRSPVRIPAGSASDRYPQSAAAASAGLAREIGVEQRGQRVPESRSRSATARSGKRVDFI